MKLEIDRYPRPFSWVICPVLNFHKDLNEDINHVIFKLADENKARGIVINVLDD